MTDTAGRLTVGAFFLACHTFREVIGKTGVMHTKATRLHGIVGPFDNEFTFMAFEPILAPAWQEWFYGTRSHLVSWESWKIIRHVSWTPGFRWGK